MDKIDIAYRLLFIFCLLVIAVIMLIYLVRSIVGPQLADRILAVNAISMLTICATAILGAWRRELYLLDVCLIYAMLSFLALVVLVQLIARTHLEKDEEEENDVGVD